MRIDFTEDNELKKYIEWLHDGGKHNNYQKSVEHAAEMGVHIDGDAPGELINSYRPNEPAEVHEYRLSIYQPITKSASARALNVINRINNTRYYSLEFPKQPKRVQDTLQNYCLVNYPQFGSVINWAFDFALREMLGDPNGVVIVRPINLEQPDNELPEPFTFSYRSDQLIDYVPGEYYTVLLDEKAPIKTGNSIEYTGNIYNVYTKTQLIEFVQIEKGDKYKTSVLLEYDLPQPPAFQYGGEYVKSSWPFCYESFMSGVLPFWNDAIREYSDKQATFVQHVYLERVEMQVRCDAKCSPKTELNGVYGIGHGDDCKKCTRCSGSGFISGRSPYGVTVVKDSAMDPDKNIEFPGVKYIEKPTDIVELLTDDIKHLIEKGYDAINMELLNNSGANQSGKAKTIDRSELDSYLLTVSNRIFSIIADSITLINYFRYNTLLPNDYNAYLPSINKPTSFDVFTADLLAEMLKSAKASGLNAHLVDELEKDYVNKQFGNNEALRQKHTLYIELDPLSNVSEEDKFTRLANGGVTKISYIVSSNIKQFVNKAIAAGGFEQMERAEQIELLNKYAQEQLTAQPQLIDRGEDGE